MIQHRKRQLLGTIILAAAFIVVVLMFLLKRAEDRADPQATQDREAIVTPSRDLASGREAVEDDIPAAAAHSAVDGSGIIAKVVDRHGNPVAAAEVHYNDGTQEIVQGVTDSNGTVKCKDVLARHGRPLLMHICAHKQGFAPGATELDQNAMTEVLIVVLQPQFTLNGVVVGPMGLQVGPGFTVAAVRDDVEANPDKFGIGRSGATWSCSEVDVTGNFAIEGLDSRHKYRLFAWGPGFIPYTSNESYGVNATPGAAIARVSPVYACKFRFMDSAGGSIRADQLLSFLTGLTYNSVIDYAPLSHTNRYLRLAGIDLSLLQAPSSSSLSVFLVPTRDMEVVDAVFGAGAYLNIPGYLPQRFDGAAVLASIEPPVYEVAMLSQSAGWGEVVVRVANFPRVSPEDLQVLALPRILGVVMLANHTGQPYAIAVKYDCAGTVTVRGVPAGTYTGWFRDTFDFFQVPPRGQEQRVEVRDGGQTTIDIELPVHGQLILHPPGLRMFNGPALRIELSRLVGSEFQAARHDPTFPFTPAAILFLPDGPYRLKADGYKLGPDLISQLEFTILAEERLEMDLVRE